MIRAYHSVVTTMDRRHEIERVWCLVLGWVRVELRCQTALGQQYERERREFDALYDAAVAATDTQTVAWAMEDYQGADRASLLEMLRTIAAGNYCNDGGEE